MKFRNFIPLIVILFVLYLSATTVESDNDGIRAIGFLAGVICGYLFNMWLEDNL